MPEASGGAEDGAAPDVEPASKIALTKEEFERRRRDLRSDQAEAHWQEGARLYQNGRYAEAAVEFERSYVAVPAAASLDSMALSYERAGKPVEAVRAWQRYLALPDCAEVPLEERGVECPDPDPDQRRSVEQALAEQRRRVGELVITLGEGVELREVRVAGRTVPLDDFPLLLLPGTVDVEVFGLQADERRSRPAYITPGEEFTLYIAPFDSKVVDEVEPSGPVLGGGVDPLRQARRQRQQRAAFWVGTGLTAVSGIALAVTGGLTRYHQLQFEASKCANPCIQRDDQGNPIFGEDGETIPLGSPSRDLYPHDHQAAFERYKPAANALLGVTIGLGVATALVGVFAFRKRDDARRPAGSGARAHVRVGGSGLVVRW